MPFKKLLLQQWHGLSGQVPDHSALSRLRNRLGDRLEGLLSSLNTQFATRGL